LGFNILRYTYMAKTILVVSGSPKEDGNTATLVEWFAQGALAKGGRVEIIQAASLEHKAVGCTSCRACQELSDYGCIIEDAVSPVLKKMLAADVIVMATPLYFFSVSAQLKVIFDRMFSLYKWDNKAGTMETPLKGKTLVLLASAFEDIGLGALQKPFKLTADYSGMKFESLLVPNAGVSGEIKRKVGILQEAFVLGEKAAQE
jgi:multimeric flavodoxin WrbA